MSEQTHPEDIVDVVEEDLRTYRRRLSSLERSLYDGRAADPAVVQKTIQEVTQRIRELEAEWDRLSALIEAEQEEDR